MKRIVLALALVAVLSPIGAHAQEKATVNESTSTQITNSSIENMTLSDAEKTELQEKVKKAEKKKILPDKKNTTEEKEIRTQEADWINTYGNYPKRPGVILVTTDNTTGHAGIVWSTYSTVESMYGSGVQRYDNDWNTRYNQVFGVTVKATDANQDNAASNWCYNQIGKPYNANLLNTSTRSSFYCSQLVWAAFKDKYNINIDDDGGIIYPVDLVNSAKTSAIYHQDN